MATTRRLAAILAADVAGYSRLMGADEEGTNASRRICASWSIRSEPKTLSECDRAQERVLMLRSGHMQQSWNQLGSPLRRFG